LANGLYKVVVVCICYSFWELNSVSIIENFIAGFFCFILLGLVDDVQVMLTFTVALKTEL